MAAILEVNNIKVKYGQVEAIHGISVKVEEGEIVSVIGANGAGKSTLLNAIMGIVKISEGSIIFKGHSLEKLPQHQIPKLGIGYVPEGRRVFIDMTVQENLNMGAYSVRNKEIKRRQMEFVFGLFPILFERRKQLAGTLSGGEQQMLAMSRALMVNPSLLL
ncbi:MAG: ABC transporter ATP-binding protein, partial [Caulobacteraceae bacterium]